MSHSRFAKLTWLVAALLIAAAPGLRADEELPAPRSTSNVPLPMAMYSPQSAVPVPAYFAPQVPRPAMYPGGPAYFESAYYVPTMPVWVVPPAVATGCSHPHCRRGRCHHRHHATVPLVPSAAVYPVWPNFTRGPRDFLYPGY